MKKPLKQVFCALLAALMFLSAVQLSAFAAPFHEFPEDDSYYEGGDYESDRDEESEKPVFPPNSYNDGDVLYEYEVLPDGTLSITSISIIAEVFSQGTYVSIPSHIDGRTVTRIANNAGELLAYSPDSVFLSIPDTVVSIGSYAFYHTDISTVDIPASVTSIGHYAFTNCPRLHRISVDDANRFYSDEDGVLFNKDKSVLITCPSGKYDYIDYDNYITAPYVVPESVVAIERMAFANCDSFPEIVLPPGLVSIGASAFADCWALESIKLPYGITDIPKEAFSNCENLDSISIPSSVKSIADDAFVAEDYSERNLNVRCASGSAAEQFCKSKGIPFTIDSSVDKIVSPNGSVVSGNIERISGSDRIKTAVEISKKGWDSTDTVVLANGFAFPDALAGAPLASALNAPILLTSGKKLEADVSSEIDRLGAETVYILGGSTVVASSVESQLRQSGMTVIRLAGATRYETSEKIAETLIDLIHGTEAVFVVSAENYPDALSVSPMSSLYLTPIVFSNKSGQITSSLSALLESNNVGQATIIGGNSAVGSAAESNLKKCGVNTVTRISGSNRYETSVRVAEAFDPGAYEGIAVATGTNYPDALAGGVLASRLYVPIVLLDPVYKKNPALDRFISGLDSEKIYVFGGYNAMPSQTVSAYFNTSDTSGTDSEYRIMTLTGTVADDSGKGVPEVEVSVYEQLGDTTRFVGSATTNVKGSFTINGAPVKKSCSSLLVETYRTGYSQASVTVSINPGDTAKTVGTIKVTSGMGTLKGTITEYGDPVYNATLNLYREVNGKYVFTGTEIYADNNGSFQLDLVPGKYYLHGSYYYDRPFYGDEVNDSFFETDPFEITSGQTTTLHYESYEGESIDRCWLYCDVRCGGKYVDGASVEVYLDGRPVASKTSSSKYQPPMVIPMNSNVYQDIYEVKVTYGSYAVTREVMLTKLSEESLTIDVDTDHRLANVYGLIRLRNFPASCEPERFVDLFIYDGHPDNEDSERLQRIRSLSGDFVFYLEPGTEYYLVAEALLTLPGEEYPEHFASNAEVIFETSEGSYARVYYVDFDSSGNITLTIEDMA